MENNHQRNYDYVEISFFYHIVAHLARTLQGYGSAKAGLIGLTRAQAISLAKHVRVNTILPGWIDTSGGSMEVTEQDQDWHPVGELFCLASICEESCIPVCSLTWS